MFRNKIIYVVIIFIVLHLSACASSTKYFKLVKGGELNKPIDYPTNVYKLKLSDTVTTHLWLHGGFNEKAILSVVINIPQNTTVTLVSDIIKISSPEESKKVKIISIEDESNIIHPPTSKLIGHSSKQFTLLGNKAIAATYHLQLKDYHFAISGKEFRLQFPEMRINNNLIKPPAFKFIKSESLRIISLN
jgi:hypothetical protein